MRRSLIIVLAMLAALTVVTIILHVIGIRLVGGIVAWQRWLNVHAWLFGVWRLGLYVAIVRGWWWMRTRVRQREPSPEARRRFWWMRTRVRQREPSPEARRRLVRAEIAAVLVIALTECVAMRFPL